MNGKLLLICDFNKVIGGIFGDIKVEKFIVLFFIVLFFCRILLLKYINIYKKLKVLSILKDSIKL